MGIEKMIAMGAAMDPELLKKGAMAHHKAIGAVTEASPTLSKADFEAVNAALAGKLGPIDAAAKKLSDASYPFIKSAPWDSDLFLKPLPGVSPNEAMKAVDKMIVMGASMDGKLLQEAAMAHSKALNSVDGKLVTDAASSQAVNAALGKVIASV